MKGVAVWLLVACGVTAQVVGCGSDDGKKKQSSADGNAGEGGTAAAGNISSGGEGGAGTPDTATGGAGASANVSGTAGDSSQTGGAPSSGTAGADQGAGGGGGADSGPAFVIGAYVSPTGNDTTGNGTLDQPFATLMPAAAAVQAGQAIGLLDGEHFVKYGVSIPDGVALVAVHPGTVTIGEQVGINGGITFLGDGAVDGLRLAWAVNFITVQAGTLTVTNTQFGKHGDGSGNDGDFLVKSGGKLVLKAPSLEAPWYYEADGGRVAQVADGGSLEVTGGVFTGSNAGSVFFVYSGTASMSFKDVSFVDCPSGRAIGLNNGSVGANNSTLELDNVKIQNTGTSDGIYVGWGKPVVTIRNSVIDTQNGIGISVEGSGYAGADVQTVNVEDSQITGNATGVRAYYYSKAAFTFSNTHVDKNAVGVRFQFVDTTGNSLDMTGGSIADNTSIGLDATTEANKPNRVKLRGVSVTGNAGTGLALYGDANAVFDLGTAADPGKNTFKYLGAANNVGAVTVNTAHLVTAVGNTWLANEQGADATGTYVPSSGQYTEVTGAVAAGKNYRIIGAGQKLWL